MLLPLFRSQRIIHRPKEKNYKTPIMTVVLVIFLKVRGDSVYFTFDLP